PSHRRPFAAGLRARLRIATRRSRSIREIAMKHDPFRVVLALLLFVSAALFVAGSIAEHHQRTAAVQQSTSASAASSTPRAEGSTSETSPSAKPRESSTAIRGGGSGSKEGSVAREAAEHAAKSSRPVPSERASSPQP